MRHAIIFILPMLGLAGCYTNPSKTEKVYVPVPTEVKTTIPERPDLEATSVTKDTPADVRERAITLTLSKLVTRVRQLECLLVPYATNGDQYKERCPSAEAVAKEADAAPAPQPAASASDGKK